MEQAQENVAVVLDNKMSAANYVNMLLNMAEYCQSNLSARQFALTKMEELLGQGAEIESSIEADLWGINNVPLFTHDGEHINESALVKALQSTDTYSQQSAAVVYAYLFSAKCVGDMDSLVAWIIFKLKHKNEWERALPAFNILCRSHIARRKLVEAGVVTAISAILKRTGASSSAQQIYELCFQLWALSLEEENLAEFIPAGAVRALVEQIAAPPSKKVRHKREQEVQLQ